MAFRPRIAPLLRAVRLFKSLPLTFLGRGVAFREDFVLTIPDLAVEEQNCEVFLQRGFGRGKKFVANVPDGFNITTSVALDFGTKTSDVDINGPGAAIIIVSPHLIEQHFTGERLARMRRKEFEQLKFFVGQVDRLAADMHFIALEINDETAE